MLYVSNYSIKVNNNEPLASRYSKIAITDTKDGVTEEVNYNQLCDVLEANPDLEIKGLNSFKLPGDLRLFLSLYIIDPDDYSTYKADYDWDVFAQPFKGNLTEFIDNITEHIKSDKNLTSMRQMFFICPDIGCEIILLPDKIRAITLGGAEFADLDYPMDSMYQTEVEPSDSFRVVLREGCIDVQIYHDGVWETRVRYSRQHREGYLATACWKAYIDSCFRYEGFYPAALCKEAGFKSSVLEIVTYNNKLLPIINDVSIAGKFAIIDTNMGRFIECKYGTPRIIGNIDPPDYLVAPQDRDILIDASSVRVKDNVSFEVDNKGNTVLLLSDRPKVYWRLQEYNYQYYWVSESRYERRVDDDDFAGIYDKLNDQFVSDYMPNVVGDDYLIKNNSDMFGLGISDIQYGVGVAELTAKYCNTRDIMREAFLGIVGASVVIFEDVKLTKLPGTDLKCGFKKVPRQEGGIKFTVEDRDYYIDTIHLIRGDSLLNGKVKTGDFNYICRYKVGKSYELGVACAVGGFHVYVFPLSTLEHLVPLDYNDYDCEWRKFNDK